MGYGDYYWGLCRDYYRDPFPYSLLSTREFCFRAVSAEEVALGCGYGLSCTVVVVVLVVVVVAW